MSYEEGLQEKRLYPEPSVITPPKGPNEQPLLAVNPVLTPASSGGNSTKSLCDRVKEPFSPIRTASECGYDYEPDQGQQYDYEPLPFQDNVFDSSFSVNNAADNHIWQLAYSPLQVPPNSNHNEANGEDGEQKKVEVDHPLPADFSEILLTPRNPESQHDEPARNGNEKEHLPKDRVKDGDAKPPPYPHNHWQMYPPPPYYWYQHYHYGYHPHYGAQDGHRRLSHPNLYPKPQNGHYHPGYHSPATPYAHLGNPPYMGPPVPPQEYIKEVTNSDVICGRGGAINNHVGNRRFRQFIQEYKHQYLTETKQRKPFVAMRVLAAVKESDPPGRFLVKYPTGYLECGDDRAREKASQALREGAAKLRKQGYGKSGPGERSVEEDHANLKRGLNITKIMLPNERAREQSYHDDNDYSSVFEPPNKKIKQEEV